MPARPIVEFRDLDGTYVLVKPLDDVRGVVLNGNRHARGEVLYKDADLRWEEAARDIGGATRLSPEDLVVEEVEESDFPTPEFTDEDGDLLEGEHEAPEDLLERGAAKSEDPLEGAYEEIGLDVMFRRLLRHYRLEHTTRVNRTRTVEDCQCPGWVPSDDDPTANWIHGLVVTALRQRKVTAILRSLRSMDCVGTGILREEMRKLRSA